MSQLIYICICLYLGKWIASQSRHNFDVQNPANGNTITSVTNCDHRDAQLAIDAAKGAFPNWGFNVTAKERAALLLSWSAIMMRRQDELAKIMTIEQVVSNKGGD